MPRNRNKVSSVGNNRKNKGKDQNNAVIEEDSWKHHPDEGVLANCHHALALEAQLDGVRTPPVGTKAKQRNNGIRRLPLHNQLRSNRNDPLSKARTYKATGVKVDPKHSSQTQFLYDNSASKERPKSRHGKRASTQNIQLPFSCDPTSPKSDQQEKEQSRKETTRADYVVPRKGQVHNFATSANTQRDFMAHQDEGQEKPTATRKTNFSSNARNEKNQPSIVAEVVDLCDDDDDDDNYTNHAKVQSPTVSNHRIEPASKELVTSSLVEDLVMSPTAASPHVYTAAPHVYDDCESSGYATQETYFSVERYDETTSLHLHPPRDIDRPINCCTEIINTGNAVQASTDHCEEIVEIPDDALISSPISQPWEAAKDNFQSMMGNVKARHAKRLAESPPRKSLFANLGSNTLVGNSNHTFPSSSGSAEDAMQSILKIYESTKVRSGTAGMALETASKNKTPLTAEGRNTGLVKINWNLGVTKRNGTCHGGTTRRRPVRKKAKPLGSTSFGKSSQLKVTSFNYSPEVEEDPIVDTESEDDARQRQHKRKNNYEDSETWTLGSAAAAPLGRKRESKKRGLDNPIQIDVSDGEDEISVTDLLRLSQQTDVPKMSTRFRLAIDLVRVCVGTLYSHACCKLELHKDHMRLNYMYRNKMQSCSHSIAFDDMKEFKFFQSNNTILAIMRVTPTAENELLTYPNKYLEELYGVDASIIGQKGYIVLETRSCEDLDRLLVWMEEREELRPFVADENEEIDEHECQQYATTMLGHIEKEQKRMEEGVSSPTKRRKTMKSKKTKTENNEIILVFPFGADAEKIDAAADGLTEVKQVIEQVAINTRGTESDCESEHIVYAYPPEYRSIIDDVQELSVEQTNTTTPAVVEMGLAIRHAFEKSEKFETSSSLPHSEGDQESDTSSSCKDNSAAKSDTSSGKDNITDKSDMGNEQDGIVISKPDMGKKKSRAHFLSVRQEDFDRLEEGEFLNDTLIDFWMQWLMRKEDKEDSPVHVFSSHFYTTLSEDGPEAVQSWTARKNIDVFSKRFVFIPINKNLHWSLCVIVNPGHILRRSNLLLQSAVDDEPSDCDIDEEMNSPVSGILFLDSLKAHKKTEVARNIREWLNAEWKRMKKCSLQKKPFDNESMTVHDPPIPYQDNSWDCGVFVCRYAYALFMRRHKILTVSDYHDAFRAVITNSAEFQFDMEDIARIRKEMKILITNLAKLYKAYTMGLEAKECAAKLILAESNQEAGRDSSGNEGVTNAVDEGKQSHDELLTLVLPQFKEHEGGPYEETVCV